MTTTRSYDHLNRLTSITSVNESSVVVDSHAYSYNTANQRTSATNADGTYWIYQYDALGQVVAGIKFWSDGSLVAGQQFGYAFDNIGNRTGTTAGGDNWGRYTRAATYSANNLNQYTSRTVPGAVDIIGTATNTATVTVNNQTTTRKGDYFWVPLSINNSSSAVWQPVTNLAVLHQGTNSDLADTNTGNVFLPQTPESYTYDADGNLTQDGRWTYTWDSENRLINMTSLTGAPAGSLLKLDFAYDSQGRRIQKIVSTNNGLEYVPESTIDYIYDGWNLLAEVTTSGSLIRGYMWGTDLSGSAQGAGGVGGLLEINYQGNKNFTCYDGNGNLAVLVNATNGTIAANYEYGPFGEVIRKTGPACETNPFRFSTKYQDDESDLLYYGFRYYIPTTGRWLSRDPDSENDGSPTLYGSFCNAAINRVDYLGLWVDGLSVYATGKPQVASQIWAKAVGTPYVGLIFQHQYSLGFHGGFGSEPGFHMFNTPKVAAALFAWEAKASYCDQKSPFDNGFHFKDWIYDLDSFEIDADGVLKTISAHVEEEPDGPTGQWVQANAGYEYAYDAPRYWMPKGLGSTFYFTGSWRIIAFDNDSAWQAKFHIEFTFDDKNPQNGNGRFSIIEEPHEITLK